MPGLRAYGRKWLIAEDDVPLPSFIMLIYHLVWIGPMISCYVITYDTVHCKNVGRTTLALSGLLVGFVGSIAAEIASIVIGLRGTMFERSKRKNLPYFVYLNTLAHCFQVSFNGYLTYLIYHDFNLNCDSRGGVWAPDDFLLALNIAEWIYILVMILFLLVVFNPRGVFSDPAAWERHYTWIMWLGICCWRPWSARERQMQRDRARRVGANLCALCGHVDFTITDAWAAFIVARTLYKQQQQQQNKGAATGVAAEIEDATTSSSTISAAPGSSSASLDSSINHPVSTITDDNKVPLVPPPIQEINNNNTNQNHDGDLFLPRSLAPLPVPAPGTLVDHATLVEAQHFFTYALATYGWMLYILENGIHGLSDVICGCGVGPVNTRVAMKTLSAPKHDILYLREEGALPDVVSYIIAVDHSTKSIVVAVRGALSIMDNVRDLLFEAAELDPWLEKPWSWETVPPPAPEAKAPGNVHGADGENKNSSYLAQGDYLNVAYQTLADILRQGILKNAISGTNSQFPGYKLVLTGHSLGAAVSYLIALRLRLAIPDLICWAFSPPLGLVSASLGAASTHWCTSVVCGKELPPRYSVATLDRALQEMMVAAVQCKLPKLQLLTGWLGGTAALNDPNEALLWKEDEVPEEVQRVLNKGMESVESNPYRQYLLETSGTFGLPGRVFHLQLVAKHDPKSIKNKTNNKRGCLGCCGSSAATNEKGTNNINTPSRPLPEREYQAVWIDGSELAKEGLKMSGRWLSDHMPDFLAGVLRQVALVEKNTTTTTAAVPVAVEEELADVEGGVK